MISNSTEAADGVSLRQPVAWPGRHFRSIRDFDQPVRVKIASPVRDTGGLLHKMGNEDGSTPLAQIVNVLLDQ